MEVKKVNELEENNDTKTLIGLDNVGDMCKIQSGVAVLKVMYEKKTGKGDMPIYKMIGIFHIKTPKGAAVFIKVSYDHDGILLGDTQHYTINESDAIKNKKIWINADTANGQTFITDYTGEDLTISVDAIGFSDADYCAAMGW